VWPAPQSGHTIVALAPLTAAHSDQLAQSLLQRLDTVPQQLAELIVGRAEGNPYYMEELVRRLTDDGVIVVGETRWMLQTDRLQNLRLPGTLVGLLQARLDALPAKERLAARQASVIGHVFWDEALQSVDGNAPPALPALQRAAFVKAHETSDFEGTTERQFDHHLLHQVTYDTLLKAERRLGHGAVARWLTERTKGRGAEFLAMTGEHAERAGETALAIDCFEQAGANARARFANVAAQSYVRRALGLLGASDPVRRFELVGVLEAIADTAGDRSAQDSAQKDMAALLESHPDDVRQAELLFKKALLADRRSDSAASEPLSRQAFELAERCGAARWAAMAQGNLAYLHMCREDHAGAARHVEIALQWAGRMAADQVRAETEVQLLTLSGMVSTDLCRFDEARETLLGVLSRAEGIGAPRRQLGTLSALANVAIDTGRWDEVRSWAERLEALAVSVGDTLYLSSAWTKMGWAAAGHGDHAHAIQRHEQALPLLGSVSNRRTQARTLVGLGISQFARGDVRGALQSYAQAQVLHQALGSLLEVHEDGAYVELCQIRLGRPDRAMTAVNQALESLDGELAGCAVHETIELRSICRQVLDALGDPRAVPLLAQLNADVQARAAAMTGAADRERLIQALPVFRAIVAAHLQGGQVA
jgi:tetratricopeptide (TPR) repeat protein